MQSVLKAPKTSSTKYVGNTFLFSQPNFSGFNSENEQKKRSDTK